MRGLFSDEGAAFVIISKIITISRVLHNNPMSSRIICSSRDPLIHQIQQPVSHWLFSQLNLVMYPLANAQDTKTRSEYNQSSQLSRIEAKSHSHSQHL